MRLDGHVLSTSQIPSFPIICQQAYTEIIGLAPVESEFMMLCQEQFWGHPPEF